MGGRREILTCNNFFSPHCRTPFFLLPSANLWERLCEEADEEQLLQKDHARVSGGAVTHPGPPAVRQKRLNF